MKAWRCTVCGHIHKGDKPPGKCPVCGAPGKMFEQITEDDGAQTVQKGDLRTTADLLVVGSGAAAFTAAVTARSRGASVIMLEKGDRPGGTTARSGGGFWIPNNRHQREAGIVDNREDCLRYMARYSYSNRYNPEAPRYGLPEHAFELLEAYWDNAHKMEEYITGQGALETIMEINWTGKPQVDYMDHLPENKGIRGRSLYPKDAEGKQSYGVELIRQLSDWAKNHDIPLYTGCRATDIRTDEEGRVNGLVVDRGGEEILFRANKGVVFGSGGYSHNDELMLRFQRGPHYGGCSVPTNTGDFISMAGSIGAQIGNMAGAFRAQSMIEEYLENPGGSSNLFYIAGDSVIIVNKYGKRIVDEKRNYTDRTMVHFQWDAQKAEWSNLLTFMIFDKRTATLWQGFPPYPVAEQKMSHLIEGDTLEALTANIEARLRALAAHTGGFALDEAYLTNLRETIARYNDFAEKGTDEDFHRGEYAYDREWTTFPPTVPGVEWPEKGTKNYTMHPISPNGPYYAIIQAAGTLDTNGGPVVDGHARVLDWKGKPIAGLYGAGNCIASPTANAYWGAGSTIGPAMTFGYLAGMDITE